MMIFAMDFFSGPRARMSRASAAQSWLRAAAMLSTVCCLLIYPALAQTRHAKSAPSDPLKQHFEAAENYQRAGEQIHAASEYRAFLAEALHRMANGKAEVGEFEAAFPLFDEALSFSPTDPDLLVDYAAACLSADRLAQARTLIEPAVKLAPQNARAHFLYGRVLFHLEDYPAAKVQLEAALAKNSDFDTGYLLGRTYLLLKNEKQARVLFHEMAAGLGDTALIHIYFGRAYSENDYPDLAVAEFRQAIAKDPHVRGAHYYLALTYLGHNEGAGYAAAVPEFQAELAAHPDDFPSRYMLGYIALQQHDLPEAEKELTRAITLKPHDVTALLQLAKVYLDTNQLPQSEATLRSAIALENDPSQDRQAVSRAHYMLGQLLQRTGRPEESHKELQSFAAMDKQLRATQGVNAEERNVNPDSLARSESHNHSDDASARNASPENLQRLQAFVSQLSPPVADAYNGLGAAAASQNDFAAAMADFKKAADWNPSIEGVDRNLGLASFYAGQYDQAIQSLQHFLQTHPDDALARSTLAQAQKAAGAAKAPQP